MMSNERLLKEYIRLVVEDDGGGHPGYTAHDIMHSGMTMMHGMPWGAHYGSSGDMYKTFIQPFVDVVKTATGKTKEMSVRAQTVLRTAFETVATTIIPILRDDYQKVFERQRSALQKVKQEYGDVYKSNWDALLHDDLLVAAFFYQPAAFFSVAAARKAPEILLSMASVLSGGQLDNWIERVKTKVKEKTHKSTRRDHGRPVGHRQTWGNRGGNMMTPYGYLPIHHKKGELGALGAGIEYYESVIREGEEGGQAPDVSRLLSSPKLREKIEQSPIVKRMEQSAQQAVRSSLEELVKKASAVMSSRTLEDLQQKTGTRLKDAEGLREMPAQEQQAVLTATRKSMKEFYVKELEAHIQAAKSAGVPADSAYVRDYEHVVSRIKAL